MKIVIDNIKIRFLDDQKETLEEIEVANIEDKVACRAIFHIVHARSGVRSKTDLEGSIYGNTSTEEFIINEKQILLSEMKTEDYSLKSRVEELEELLKVARYEYYKLEQGIVKRPKAENDRIEWLYREDEKEKVRLKDTVKRLRKELRELRELRKKEKKIKTARAIPPN